MVGWPLYYASNTAYFAGIQNTYGIFGMNKIGPAGRTAFLQGLDGQQYSYNTSSGVGPGVVINLTSQALYYCNYYGLYPSPSQTASRSMPYSVLTDYNLTIAFQMFGIYNDSSSNSWVGGALFTHSGSGALLALGLTRTPDVRLTALGLLGYYTPALYPSEQTASGSSRLIVLSIGRMGGM
jgi:hypothetical protein